MTGLELGMITLAKGLKSATCKADIITLEKRCQIWQNVCSARKIRTKEKTRRKKMGSGFCPAIERVKNYVYSFGL